MLRFLIQMQIKPPIHSFVKSEVWTCPESLDWARCAAALGLLGPFQGAAALWESRLGLAFVCASVRRGCASEKGLPSRNFLQGEIQSFLFQHYISLSVEQWWNRERIWL